MRRAAFTLMEVLVATALFGLAAASLLLAFTPTHEALFRLSNTTRDAGDLEIAKALAASAKDREALLKGADTSLPDGRALRWRAAVEPTETEALFLVRLDAERDGDTPLRAEYLHFEPKWLLPDDEKPRWLAHASASAGASPGQVRGGTAGGNRTGRSGRGDATASRRQGGENSGRAGREPGTRREPAPGARPPSGPGTGGSR